MTICERCRQTTNCFTVSMFNFDVICPVCKTREAAHPLYAAAQEAEIAACRSGNLNFEGIGCPPELLSPSESN